MYQFLLTILVFCISSVYSYVPRSNFPIIVLPQNQASFIKLLNSSANNFNMTTNGEKKFLETAIKDHNIVFDVGANEGGWSKYAYKTKTNITIYAFEPIPGVFKNLCNNFPYASFKPFNIALSDEIGEALFYSYPNTQSTKSGLYDRPILHNQYHLNSTTISVKTDTLDHFCLTNDISHIDFLKIDTEGAEWTVLQGAKGLLKDQKIKAIQFEYGGCYIDAKTTLFQVADFLTKNGYVIFYITPKGLLYLSYWDNAFENYKYGNFAAILQSEVKDYPLMEF